ncbi:hypothetical protein L195_g033117, partial [Trifolium pratense]
MSGVRSVLNDLNDDCGVDDEGGGEDGGGENSGGHVLALKIKVDFDLECVSEEISVGNYKRKNVCKRKKKGRRRNNTDSALLRERHWGVRNTITNLSISLYTTTQKMPRKKMGRTRNQKRNISQSESTTNMNNQ